MHSPFSMRNFPALATLARGVDNTLSRPLAERDPAAVAFCKATAGSAPSALLAFAFAEPRPAPGPAAALRARA